MTLWLAVQSHSYQNNDGVTTNWPRLVAPELAVKLNNMCEAANQYSHFEALLSGHVHGAVSQAEQRAWEVSAEDDLLESPPNTGRERFRTPLRGGSELSFMSASSFEMVPAPSNVPETSEMSVDEAPALPAALSYTSGEVQLQVRQCQQDVHAALKSVFEAALLHHIRSLLESSHEAGVRASQSAGTGGGESSKRAGLWGWLKRSSAGAGTATAGQLSGRTSSVNSSGSTGEYGDLLLSGVDTASTARLEQLMDFMDRELQVKLASSCSFAALL
jgi:hypothetical protein